MPELPEVETTARGLRDRLLGRTVTTVGSVDWPAMLPNVRLEELAGALVGRRVEAVERRGKFLLLRFESGAVLAFHRKMSGNLLLRGQSDPPEPHTHLTLDFDDGQVLRFVDARKFGRVHLFASEADAAAYLEARLGPEPLEGLDGQRLAGLLAGRRGRIKSLLLDQSVLAGVGNIYADEALWAAGIHPLRPADSLTQAELNDLAAAIVTVLSRAIERRGTTFSAYLDAEGGRGENQDFLRVYGRGPSFGRVAWPCDRCDTLIERIVLGQRSSHFCPTCQPLRLSSAGPGRRAGRRPRS